MANDWKKNPTHTVYNVRDYEKATGEADASWTPIGVAFIHKDGKGFNLDFDAFPRSGRAVMRLKMPKKKKEE